MSTSKPSRDPLVILGLSVVTLAAAISSFGALYGAALIAGWTKTMAPLLPVTVDATALTATRIWLAASTPTEQARGFARSTAFGAVVVSLLGNGVYHLAEAGVVRPGVALVIAAGAVSPVALAVVSHLAVLRGTRPAAETVIPAPVAVPVEIPAEVPAVQDTPVEVPVAALPEVPVPEVSPREEPPVNTDPGISAETSQKRPVRPGKRRTDDELIVLARKVNTRSLEESGRPAGVTRLRTELRVGQARAQALRDAVAAA